MFTAMRSMGVWLSEAAGRLLARLGDEEIGREPCPERREEARLPDGSTTMLTIICDGRHLSTLGRLEDVTDDGVRVRCAAMLEVGDSVRCTLHTAGAPTRVVRFTVVWGRGGEYGLRCTSGGYSHFFLRQYVGGRRAA